MARPKKDIIDYFPHPVKNGSKMFIMEQKYGDKGYMAYYKILELLGASEGHFLNFSNNKDRYYFNASIRSNDKLTEEIILTLCEIGALDEDLWLNKKIIWCQDLIDSVADLYSKRNRNVPLRPVSDINNSVSDSQNTQSIVKESKVEEIKVNDIEERKLKFSETLKPYIEKYGREMCLNFYYYWSEPNKSNSKFKQELQATWDLYSRLRTWAKNDKNFNNGKQQGSTNYHSTKTDVTELVAGTIGKYEQGNMYNSSGGN